MSEEVKELSKLYAEFERYKTEAKAAQDSAKNIKDEIIAKMEEMGRDEVVVSGLDSEAVVLTITYPIREVLNKKKLAEALGVKIKDLNMYQTWIELTNQQKLTTEMIEEFTEEEERMQFSSKVFQEE